LGQDSDTAFLRDVPGVEFERDGTVVVSQSLETGCPGLFAGGDMVPSERTVTVGVGHGKKAARHIDVWLRGGSFAAAPRHDLASFDRLNLWYFGDNPRRQQPELEPGERVADFDEVVGSLSAKEAVYEAGASTTTAARAARRASSSARCTRSRWCRSRTRDARDARPERGGVLCRRPAARGL